MRPCCLKAKRFRRLRPAEECGWNRKDTDPSETQTAGVYAAQESWKRRSFPLPDDIPARCVKPPCSAPPPEGGEAASEDSLGARPITAQRSVPRLFGIRSVFETVSFDQVRIRSVSSRDPSSGKTINSRMESRTGSPSRMV